jgi:hypothetical protein
MKSAHSTTNISAQANKHEDVRSALDLFFGVHSALGLPQVIIGTVTTSVAGKSKRHSTAFDPSNVDEILQSIPADAEIRLSPIAPPAGTRELYTVPDHVPDEWIPEGDYRAAIFLGYIEIEGATDDEQSERAEFISEFLRDQGFVTQVLPKKASNNREDESYKYLSILLLLLINRSIYTIISKSTTAWIPYAVGRNLRVTGRTMFLIFPILIWGVYWILTSR